MATFFAPAANNNFLPEHTSGPSHVAEIAMWSVVGIACASLMVALGVSVAHSETHVANATLHAQGPINPPTAVIPGSTQDANGHVHLAAPLPGTTPAPNAMAASTLGQPSGGNSAPPPANGAPPSTPQGGGSAPFPGPPPVNLTPASPNPPPPPPSSSDQGGLIDIQPPDTTPPPPPPDTTPPDTAPPDTTPPDTTPPDTAPPTTTNGAGDNNGNGSVPPAAISGTF